MVKGLYIKTLPGFKVAFMRLGGQVLLPKIQEGSTFSYTKNLLALWCFSMFCRVRCNMVNGYISPYGDTMYLLT